MTSQEQLQEKCQKIDNFTDKLGETFFDAIMEEDNSTYEMARSILRVLQGCETEEQYNIADSMVTAICGYCIDSLIDKIEERDADGYCWESC